MEHHTSVDQSQPNQTIRGDGPPCTYRAGNLTLRCLSEATGAEEDADDGLAQLGEEDMSDNELVTSEESGDEEEFQTLPDESGDMGGDQVQRIYSLNLNIFGNNALEYPWKFFFLF